MNKTAIEIIHAQLNTSVVTRGRVVFIGLGGIGMPLAKTAATFLAGLQKAMPDKETDLLLCDGDKFEFSNTYRMDVPKFANKAEAVGELMLESYLDVPGFSVRWKPEYVKPDNIAEIIKEGDCVMLAVDNHATRKLVSEHCQGLENVVLISGGNDGVDDGLRGTYGNVQVYIRENGEDVTAPLTRFHPEIASPADKAPHEMDCLEMAAAGIPQISMVNLAVASAMCNALMRLMMPVEGEQMYDEMALDILEGVCQPHWLSRQQWADEISSPA
jgi:molybdopterin/thiamine biosynthesis adenylyltransferase